MKLNDMSSNMNNFFIELLLCSNNEKVLNDLDAIITKITTQMHKVGTMWIFLLLITYKAVH